MKIGDFCWVKMRGFSPWPSRIVQHPNQKEQEKNSKKGRHYVYFFGDNSYGWASEKHISRNSEEIMKEAKKKKSNPLKRAIKAFELKVEEKKYCEQFYDQGIIKQCRIMIKRLNPETSDLEESQTLDQSLSPKMEQKDELPRRKIPKIVSKEPLSISDNSKTKGVVIDPESSSTSSITFDPSASLRKEREDEFPQQDLISTENALTHKNSSTKTGFIYLEETGKGFLECLEKVGHTYTFYKESASSSPAELLATHDIIVCCVSNENEVDSIFRGEKGILQGLHIYGGTGKGVIMISNIQLSNRQLLMSKEIAEVIQKSGGKYLEAHFYGSEIRDLENNLLLVTGDEFLFQRCRVIFSSGDQVTFLGSDIEKGLKIMIIIESFLKNHIKSYAEVQTLLEDLKRKHSVKCGHLL